MTAIFAGIACLSCEGWPPKKIQMMLRHSSMTMTYDVYGHLFQDPAKDVDLMGRWSEACWQRDLKA